MRTLILSDLHLGSITRSDLLRRSELRAPLLQAIADVDRVVLLGDVLELRQGPPRAALGAARALLEDIGRALVGRELIVVPGNHDHALIEPWLAARAEQDEPQPLGAEQPVDLGAASPMLARMAEWASPARLTVSYPGIWLRDDVYATHGHYLDLHLTVPTLERLSVALMSRLLRLPADELRGAQDYEAVVSPIYEWRHAMARNARTGNALNGIATVQAWRALGGGGLDRTPSDESAPGGRAAVGAWLRTRALVGGFPIAVAALNRAGLGPLCADVSLAELRAAGLRAMAQVAARLGLGEAYVIFGHTHRAGPLPGDDQREWRGAASGAASGSGARLINTGCWTYDSLFLTANPGESPYWPGTCVLVEDSGAPVSKRLLLDRSRAELRAGGSIGLTPPPA